MLDKLTIKLLGGDRRMKERCTQTLYLLSQKVGEVRELIEIAKEGRESDMVRRRLEEHKDKYGHVKAINWGMQRSKTKVDYIVKFNKEVVELNKEYGEKIKELEGVLA
jgi:hypothetical protein